MPYSKVLLSLRAFLVVLTTYDKEILCGHAWQYLNGLAVVFAVVLILDWVRITFDLFFFFFVHSNKKPCIETYANNF